LTETIEQSKSFAALLFTEPNAPLPVQQDGEPGDLGLLD
jgi:hypothetical protein